MAEADKLCWLALEHGPLVQLHLQQLSSFGSSLHCLSLAVTEKKKFGYYRNCSVDQTALELRHLHASVF